MWFWPIYPWSWYRERRPKESERETSKYLKYLGWGWGVGGPVKGDIQNQRGCLNGCSEGICSPKSPHPNPIQASTFPKRIFLKSKRQAIYSWESGMVQAWRNHSRGNGVSYRADYEKTEWNSMLWVLQPPVLPQAAPGLASSSHYQTGRQGSSFLYLMNSRELAFQFWHLQPDP